jgi:large subunit ribosomal protein L22
MATATQEYRAEARFQRVSPQKARLVLDLIRGLRVGQALETVAFTRKRVAPLVEKVLRSAIDNASYLSQERGEDLDVDRLWVKQAIANEGPRMKRVRPAPMGRAYRYQRRMSHIIISVAEKGGSSLATTVGEDTDAALAPKKQSPARKLVAAAKKSTTGKKAATHKAGAHKGGEHKAAGHTAGSKKSQGKKTGQKNK